MIEVTHLSKTFRVPTRAPGLSAALRSLFKREYREVRAVQDISFAVGQGEIVGFLGPNGAGKTTTLKMLSGLLHPSSGSVRVASHEPAKRASAFLKQIMLVMGQKQQLLWDLPPADTFELNRAIYDVDRVAYKKHLDALVSLLAIGDVIKRPARQLSLGERMKCELAAALIHQPSVLFLDEPTIGLDVSMQSTVREFIRHYSETHQATVLLTSHYMQDVAALCERVIVIDQGTLAYDGDLSALAQQIRPEKRIALRLASPVEHIPAELGELVEREALSVTLRVAQQRVSETVARALSLLPVQDLSVEDPPLEEVMSAFFTKHRTPTEPS